MKIYLKLTFIISLISIGSFSQIIEEKNEGKFLLKNYLNENLEIIKVEKYENNNLYESVEYLPGGKIKNGKFFHKLYGNGNYVNGRLENGEILYLFITSDFDNSWYIDTKNKIFVRNDRIKTTYANNNQPIIKYEYGPNNWVPIQNYDKNKVVNNIFECHYAKLKISNFRLKGNYQINKGLFSSVSETLYEKTDNLNDLVAVVNFDNNGLLDGEQLYFKEVHYGLIDGFNRDDRKILHTAFFKNGRPLKYCKRIMPKKNDGVQIYIDSITFNSDDLKNSTFLYDSHIVNHPQPTLVFNPFSGFVQLTNHYYFNNDQIGSNAIINADNANIKSLLDSQNTHISNDLKKIIFRRSKEESLKINDDLFLEKGSNLSVDTKPDIGSNERKIIFSGKPKVFYIQEINFIDRIIKNDYNSFPYAFLWQEPGIKNSNEISSIELIFWYEYMLKGSSEMHNTYFSKTLDKNGNMAKFEGYGNSSYYESVSFLRKDIENGVIVEGKENIIKNDDKKIVIENSTSLSIGQDYLGGIIFYLDQNGKNGLITTKKDIGKFNLKDAFEKCKAYENNGNGWYLPSVDELTLIYQNLKVNKNGTFKEDYYWSSDEGRNVNFGNAVDFLTGDRTFGDMGVNAELFVMPVKKF